MELAVFLLVLCSAVVHATWNAMIKAATDRQASFETMFVAQGVTSICLIPFVAIPAPESWPNLAASAVLSVGYVYFLQRAYRVGDFSQIYPLARGVAPLLVAIASVLILKEEIGFTAQAAVFLISLGIISLSLSRGADDLRNPKPVLWALGSSCFIACYTVVDGIGARVSGSPHGYIVWLSLLTSILVPGLMRAASPGARPPVSWRTRRIGIVAGLMSYAAGWIVIWAMTQAPLPLVSALRETSVVFAVVIGITVFKERVRVFRMASIAVTLAGAALLKIGR
ncbi:MAG: EamA family transporter [Proteobacteria bacterium]|nr:EamA family transporter [Pseudomonadota bacterium]